jgi:type IV fimbrial biogenesis protein FimT
MLKLHAPERGFTLIEVMIALVVLGVLIALGAPSFSDWTRNQQIRSASEAILNGLQVARGEAVRRNLLVQFQLTSLPSSAWTVSESVSGTPIQSRVHEEGTLNTSVAATPGDATKATFAPLGNIVANLDATSTLTALDVTNAAASTSSRPLRVLITGGGSIRMCDPDPDLNLADPRRC